MVGMAEYESFDNNVEVNGQTVLAFVQGVPSAFEEHAVEILAEHGITEPTVDEWYPLQAWLDAFEEIETHLGAATVNRIGESIPANADWPSSVEVVLAGLEMINDAYHLNHRNGEIGYYDAEQVDEQTIQVHCKNPYPCTFDQGIISAIAQQYAHGQAVFVTEISEHCRSDGGDECVYQVEL